VRWEAIRQWLSFCLALALRTVKLDRLAQANDQQKGQGTKEDELHLVRW
jgi:hypothetical protein